MTLRNISTMCVLMLLSGIVLTGCESAQVKEERQSLLDQNADLKQRLQQANSNLAASEAQRNSLSGELNRLRAELNAARATPAPAPVPAASANTPFTGIEGIETERKGQEVYVRIPGDVLFAPGQITLKPTALSTLDKVAAVIQKEYPSKLIRIEGHADTDPIKRSKWEDNLELSLQRAAAVHRHLLKKGLDHKRIYSAGYGDVLPRESKARSRRVEIVVLLNS